MGVTVDMRSVKVWCETCQRVHDGWERLCPDYRPVVNWKELSPREVLEALRDAPLVAGPWEVLAAENDTPEGRKADDAEMVKNGWILVD